MSSRAEYYKEVVTRLEEDLNQRRVKNDSSLSDLETAELRGEIKYIKNLISKLTERVNIT